MTNSRGWGLFAGSRIQPNKFIIEYVGEALDERQFHVRMKAENKENDYYYVKVDRNLYIDAQHFGNISRFINHSCEPNSRLEKWTTYDQNYGEQMRVGFFSNREIQPNEEICFDYAWKTKMKCLCGNEKCRNFI